jgi:hypothetical protein
MSASLTPSPASGPAELAPSRPVLDDKKKAKIIALLANGSSRRMAAQYVGCAPSTITRTAARDPRFREQLAAAEQTADIDALRALRVAARRPRYWRAAAWLLERRNPKDFAPRKPETYTVGEFASFVASIVEGISENMPEENYQRIIRELDQLHEMTKEDVQAERAAHFRSPDLEREWAEAEHRREVVQQSRLDQDDDQHEFQDDKDDFEDETPPASAISPLPVEEGPGVRQGRSVFVVMR